MNKLRSVFISAYMMFLIAMIGLGIYQIVSSNALAYIGLLTATVPPLMFFMSLMGLKMIPRTSQHLPVLTIIIALSVPAALTIGSDQQEAFITPLILSVLSLVLWLVYNLWYSRLGGRTAGPLEVGNVLPNVSLENENGAIVHTDSMKGSPSLMLFYRGNWCPLCMAQIKEIAKQYQQLVDRGVRIALISPQSQEHTRSLSKKFNIPFTFLVDKDAKAAKQLGIFHKDGTPFGMEVLGYDSDTVLPTVIITDTDNKIIFADLTDNYRVRPEPETFIKILDDHPAIAETVNT